LNLRRYNPAVALPPPSKTKAGAKNKGAGSKTKAKPAAKESSGPSAVEVMERTVGIISTLVGRDVEAEEPLMDAGLDSLSGAELKSQMETAFGVELPETAVFDCRAGGSGELRSPCSCPRVNPRLVNALACSDAGLQVKAWGLLMHAEA